MKKLYALGLLVVPLFLAAAWMGTRATYEVPQQEVVGLPSYQLESHHFAMDDLGSLLEQMGRDIQQDEQFTIGGTTYPLSGFGGIEFNVGRRTRGDVTSTGVQLDFSSAGRTTTPANPRTGQPREDYDPYKRSGRAWGPSGVADLIAELAETLAGTGEIVLEHHRVPFKGTARIDQRLLENDFRGNAPRGNAPYNLEVNVLFGEGEFEGPDDDQDYTESQERGLTTSLARAQQEGADQAAVAQMFATLAEDLRSGLVRVGDEQLPAGDNMRFALTHVAASDGSYDKIELGLSFGPQPPSREPGEARFGEEQFNEPMSELAAKLQRMAAQILEDGTFELDGETYSATRTASWDFYASDRGFAVEVSFLRTPEQ